MKIAFVCLLCLQDETPFESKEHGLKLAVPKGWSVESSRAGQVILKIQKSELAVQINDIRPSEPLTLGQQRERLRSVIQSSIRDSRITDERAVSVGSVQGFLFTVESKGEKEADVISINGLWFLSPKRFLGIDAVSPKANAGELRQTVDRLIASMTLSRRALPPIEGPAQGWGKLKEPAKIDTQEELDIVAGDKVIGTYSIQLCTKDGGYELNHVHRVDYGDDGKEVSTVQGFLAADLSRQSVRSTLHRTTRDKRSLYLTADAELKEGKISIRRRLNGELSEASFEVPPGTVLADLVEAAHHPLIDLGKGLSSFPVLNLFDGEPGPVHVESLGQQKVKIDTETVDIFSISVAQDTRVLTYWYGADRKLLRITGFGAGVSVRRKK